MKKFRTMIAMMVAAVSLCVVSTSCGSDKDEPALPAAKSVEGIYKGDLKSTVMGSTQTFDNLTMTLKAVDEATVDITVSDFGEKGMRVAGLVFKGIKVTGADGVYALPQTNFSGKTEAGKSFSGPLQGAFAKEILTLRFTLNYGAMPMPMVCEFTGKR